MSAEFARTEAATIRAVSRGFAMLPPKAQLFLLIAGLLVAIAGCTAVKIDGWDVGPGVDVCRSDEVTRTDCVHITPTQVPADAGVAR